ncbi:lipase family alpha/beta hydrolase [Alkanindiges sp. WGS2144]|uniref:lipase family alpha/beta hydrolase n=1 Tax=Alkanindiges sp. WGS2144 TaxID=3366808 RepID=UPI003752730C
MPVLFNLLFNSSVLSCSSSVKKQLVLAAFSGLFLLSGCQVVKVKQQPLAVSLSNERDSILVRSRLSEATLSVLSSTGQDPEQCIDNPKPCLTELRKVPQVQDEQYLSVSSELYIAKVNQLKKTAECRSPLEPEAFSTDLQGLGNKIVRPVHSPKTVDWEPFKKCLAIQQNLLANSIRHAYAYLFYTDRDAKDRMFDNRQVQVRDFYHQALATLVATANQLDEKQTYGNKPLQIGDTTFYFHNYSTLNKNLLSDTELLPAYDLNFRGLQSINRRDGFGAEFVSIVPEEATVSAGQVNSYNLEPEKSGRSRAQADQNIHKARYLPVTIVAKPRGNSVEDILNSRQFDIALYNPYEVDSVNIDHETYPLAANFSAPYGMWLARTDLAAAAYRGLFARENRLIAPQLYMLEPYNPDKRVIIMIHGLASSPEAWIRLTHNVLGDTVLREHYQVWQVFYSTNMPILESRYQIHALIDHAFEQVDSQAQARASHQAVLIGHSMGAVIARLLMSNDDLRPDALLDIDAYERKKLMALPIVQQRFTMQALPEVGRMVLLSAPLRGTDYADRWFTRAIRKVIRLPRSFAESIITGVQNADMDQRLLEVIHQLSLTKIQNGPSDLSKKSDFIHLTQDAHIVQGLPFHSIMGNIEGNVPKTEITDGIVTYNSAHLDGAVSEKIIEGGHSIQETPEAILELRRILRLHLEKLGDVPAEPQGPKT